MAQSVKMKGKAPFYASRHVVSDLRLRGNKTSREGESHGKSLLLHKAPRSIGNRSMALVLATAQEIYSLVLFSVDSITQKLKKPTFKREL